jgi:lysophospholipase L1-like esterase
MLARFRADVVQLYPKVVVILAGINDLAGNTGPSTLEMIEDNLSSMAEIAQANGIQVIMSSVLPVYEFKYKPEFKPAEDIIELNKWMKKFSTKNRYVYLDFYSSMVDHRKGLIQEYTEDGLHPNKAGYRIMESLAEKAIKQSLKR